MTIPSFQQSVSAAPAPGSSDLRVLYVTGRGDAPYRYRCLHPALQLRAEGVACDILHICDRRLARRLPCYSVVVLFRMPWSTEVEELVDQARRGGAVLVFDIDDLIFDPELAEQMPFWAQASRLTRLQYRGLSLRLRRTLEACDVFIGATPALARAAEGLGQRAFVYPNLLHPGLVAASRRIRTLRAARPPGPVVGYMSGSMTHNEDFARVAPILGEIMSRRPEVNLLVGGFLEIDGRLRPYADRIIKLPFQDWRVQPWSMCLVRLNLAPLSVVNDFTDGKSALKFFEAAAVGVPTVATPTESFRAAIKHGVNGYLAEDPEEWREAITAGLDDPVSKRIGSAAADTALAEHSPAGQRFRLRDLLQSINGRAAKHFDGWLPIPPDHPDPAVAPGAARRMLSRAARLRALVGLIRRMGDPVSLSRPDLSERETDKCSHVEADPPGAVFEDRAPQAWSANAEQPRDSGAAELIVLSGSQPLGLWREEGVFLRVQRGNGESWWRCRDHRAALVSPELEIIPASYSAILVSLAVDTHESEGYGRIAWRTASGGFREKANVQFPLICDGQLHRYLVRLPRKAWSQCEGPIRQLRWHPFSTSCTFRPGQIMLLADWPADRGEVEAGRGEA